MGLPKNFHYQQNLPKMYEALKDLNFYEFEYSVILTVEYNKTLRQAEILGHFIENDLKNLVDYIYLKSELTYSNPTTNVLKENNSNKNFYENIYF